MDQWMKIDGEPYEVSSDGCVRRIGGSILKPRPHANGYQRVSLGAGKDAYIHRLVCRAFHGEAPSSDCHADHINGQRSDNRASNLRWLTRSENLRNRKCAHGENHHAAKLTDELVKRIRSSTHYRGFDADFAREHGISRETVRDARLGKLWRKTK